MGFSAIVLLKSRASLNRAAYPFFRAGASSLSTYRSTVIRKLKDHVKDVAHEASQAHPQHTTEPEAASLFAVGGYRLIKALKSHVKAVLNDSPPAYHTNRCSGLPSDGRGTAISSPWYAYPFKAVGTRGFRAVMQSTNTSRCHTNTFKWNAHFDPVVKHSVNPSSWSPHAGKAVKHSSYVAFGTARSVSYALSSSQYFRTVWRLNAKFFAWSSWKAAWQKLSRSLLPPVGLTLKVASLAFARSHLPLGIMAVIFGGMNHGTVYAQGITSFESSRSAFVFSSLYTVFEFLGLIARSLYLWILFMPAVLTAPFANMFGGRYRQAWLHLVHRTLEYAGAAFIKWGQWAATRPDLFPRDLCVELTKLHSNAPAHNFSYTVRSIEHAFGKSLDDIFLEFDERPVASGSIARVHKATLRHGGPSGKQQTVAVKVRHPGVTEEIRRDFTIINWIASLSTFIPGLKWLRLDESVRQFAVFMLTQVDLAREAAHLSRFLYNFRSWRDVSFPRPVYPLVHPAVLVETYEQGESVSNFIELSEKSQLNRRLARIGTNTFLKMLLVDNFIHADMHPGNILVRVKKGKPSSRKRMRMPKPHVIFLDVGLTAELSQKDRGNLMDFFKAVALRDGRTAAQCALAFSNKQSCPDPEAFTKELEVSFNFWGSKEADIIHPGECMQELLEQVRRHQVNVDGNVCTVMVTIMVLEGWQRKLDPDYNLMNTLQSLLFKQDLAESLSYAMHGIVAP